MNTLSVELSEKALTLDKVTLTGTSIRTLSKQLSSWKEITDVSHPAVLQW
jgi:hypothetical protein